jgi:hypothetical protein
VNWKTDYIGFLDATTVQNATNTIRILYEPDTKNTEKFKINATGFQGANCRSVLQFTPNTRAHEMGKIIVEVRLANTDTIEGQNLLLDALTNPNLTDKYIVNELKIKRDSAYEYREKSIIKSIMKKLTMILLTKT